MILGIVMQKVTIYTTDYCPYCTKVKNFFDKKGISYEEIDLSKDPERRSALVAQTKLRTVPQVFIGDTFVGGCDDTIAMDARGELMGLLER
jgi:glutaredoxin 3